MERSDDDTFLTVAVPTLNEEKYILQCLSSLLSQLEDVHGEILVLDGGSCDATQAIVAELAREHPCLRLIENRKRYQSAAVNLAAFLASPKSKIILRADAHASYPDNFISDCVHALRRSSADSIVVPMRTIGSGCFQRAVAAAQNSILGNGGATHRNGGTAGFVDHGHHAAFDIEVFRKLGGYNEGFTHNEDAEFDHRLTAAGGRIFMNADTVVEYFPRDRALALARQYYNHGRGRGRTILLHRIRPKLRQLLPLATFLGVLAGLLLSVFFPLFLIIPVTYVGLCTGIAVAQAVSRRDRCMLALGIAAMIMHMSWAAGFMRVLVTGGFGNLRTLADNAAPAGASSTADSDSPSRPGPEYEMASNSHRLRLAQDDHNGS